MAVPAFTTPFTYPSPFSPWGISPQQQPLLSAPLSSTFASSAYGAPPLQQVLPLLQIVPQQLQHLQQLVSVQLQELQQLQQIIQLLPAQLQQIQQLIQFVPQQLQQLSFSSRSSSRALARPPDWPDLRPRPGESGPFPSAHSRAR